MGSRGPVPKRSDRRLGHVTKAEKEAVTHASAGSAPAAPQPDPEWHSVAQEWFRSLAESGQAQFYEASDWATARYVAEGMSRNLDGGRFSAQLFAAVNSAMSNLLVTEGDRRRVRLELQRGDVGPMKADVPSLEDYRSRLTGG
jgi:hypothetical protein